MKLDKKDITIGLIVLAVLGGIIFFVYKGKKAPQLGSIPTPTLSPQEKIEESFNVTIPDNIEKADLADVTGGNSTGIATREYTIGVFKHTVLADLPDPENGQFYEGWLASGEESISTGKMRTAKGGYILEYNSSVDYSDWNKVVVTVEKVNDKLPEKHVLEGSF